MRITLIIIRSFRPLNHTDIKQHHLTAHPVNLPLRHLNVTAPHNIIINLLQLRRHNLRDKFLGKHFHLSVLTSPDLITEIFQLRRNQPVKRMVIIQQIKEKNLVRHRHTVPVHSRSNRIHDITHALLSQQSFLKLRQRPQPVDKLIHPNL